MNNFNSYAGYNQFGQPYVNIPNQYYNQNFQQQPNQQNQSLTNIIYVNGEDGAKTQFVPANGVGLFLDNDKPLAYRKTVDSTGHFEIKTFKIEEISPTENLNKTSSVNLSDYVKKTDIEPIFDELKQLKDKLYNQKKTEVLNGTTGSSTSGAK